MVPAMPKASGSDSRIAKFANEFLTVTYRFSYLMVSQALKLGVPNEQSEIALVNAFFAISDMTHFNLDLILGRLSNHKAKELDHVINNDLRNDWFDLAGLDFAASNIQRGYDHGIPGYNAVCVACNLSPNATFLDITGNQALANQLSSVYASPNDVDIEIPRMTGEVWVS